MDNILKCAKDSNVSLPISKLIQSMYQNIVDRGDGNDDHSSLYKEFYIKIKNNFWCPQPESN